jgi:transcription-repair coupling factor (superfamily II helicase)
MDVFPMGSELPVRIELFDNEIESLRFFDPETQRSLDAVQNIQLLPATEYPMTKAGAPLSVTTGSITLVLKRPIAQY